MIGSGRQRPGVSQLATRIIPHLRGSSADAHPLTSKLVNDQGSRCSPKAGTQMIGNIMSAYDIALMIAFRWSLRLDPDHASPVFIKISEQVLVQVSPTHWRSVQARV